MSSTVPPATQVTINPNTTPPEPKTMRDDDSVTFSKAYDEFPEIDPGCPKTTADIIGPRANAMLWDRQREAYYNGRCWSAIGYGLASRSQHCCDLAVTIPPDLFAGMCCTLVSLSYAACGILCCPCLTVTCCGPVNNLKCALQAYVFGCWGCLNIGDGLFKTAMLPCGFICPELSAARGQHMLNAAIEVEREQLGAAARRNIDDFFYPDY